MKLCSVSVLAALMLSPLHAEDAPRPLVLKTISGLTYRGVVVQAVEPDGLRITHQNGAAKIPFEALDAVWQAQYPFNAEKAAAFREEKGRGTEGIKAQAQPDKTSTTDEREENAFKVFRAKIQATIKSGKYDAAKLEATLDQWIRTYGEAGKDEWMKLLEADRELLSAPSAAPPADPAAQRAQELEEENARLQDQIDSLRSAVDESDAQAPVRSTVYDPVQHTYFGGLNSYGLGSSNVIIVRPPHNHCPPVVTPCPIPVHSSPKSFGSSAAYIRPAWGFQSCSPSVIRSAYSTPQITRSFGYSGGYSGGHSMHVHSGGGGYSHSWGGGGGGHSHSWGGGGHSRSCR